MNESTTIVSDYLEFLDTMKSPISHIEDYCMNSKYGEGKAGAYRMALGMMKIISENDEDTLSLILGDDEHFIITSVFTLICNGLKEHLQGEGDNFGSV
jgi:hypothetical protein|tara:strand:- start:6710 stop:7003 length:294 start_codon:yes stop_codon:yes gene_type:complete